MDESKRKKEYSMNSKFHLTRMYWHDILFI